MHIQQLLTLKLAEIIAVTVTREVCTARFERLCSTAHLAVEDCPTANVQQRAAHGHNRAVTTNENHRTKRCGRHFCLEKCSYITLCCIKKRKGTKNKQRCYNFSRCSRSCSVMLFDRHTLLKNTALVLREQTVFTIKADEIDPSFFLCFSFGRPRI